LARYLETNPQPRLQQRDLKTKTPNIFIKLQGVKNVILSTKYPFFMTAKGRNILPTTAMFCSASR